MKNFIKRFGGILYIVLAAVVVLLIVLNSGELPVAARALKNLDVRWIWACVGAMAAYVFSRCLTLYYYLRRQKVEISLGNALIVSGVGQFYSAITPSASGGQPMQILSMHRLGVPVSKATASLSVKFIGFQCAYLLVGFIMWLTQWDMVVQRLGPIRWLVILGYLVNLSLIAGVALTMRRSRWIVNVVAWGVRLAARLHFVKDEAAAQEKARDTLDDYQKAFSHLVKNPLDGFVVFLLSCLQILFLMSLPYLLFRAFGLTGWSWSQLTTLQLLLFIAAAFVPLPGAAGAQEGGFYLFFQGIFPEGEVLAAMLCWRLFSYYLLMAFGLVTVILETLSGWMHGRKKNG